MPGAGAWNLSSGSIASAFSTIISTLTNGDLSPLSPNLGFPCPCWQHLEKRSTMGVARGTKGAMPPKCLENIVILCFERRFSKQNIRLKSNISPPPFLGWLRHCAQHSELDWDGQQSHHTVWNKHTHTNTLICGDSMQNFQGWQNFHGGYSHWQTMSFVMPPHSCLLVTIMIYINKLRQ